MYLVSNALYLEMATHLLEEIDTSSYYSGVVEFSCVDSDNQEVDIRLVASLIIYRTTISMPEGDAEVISNIVPVWLECHTFVEKEEKINDFDIEELKIHSCVWI